MSLKHLDYMCSVLTHTGQGGLSSWGSVAWYFFEGMVAYADSCLTLVWCCVQDVPVVVVFKAMGMESDQEIVQMIGESLSTLRRHLSHLVQFKISTCLLRWEFIFLITNLFKELRLLHLHDSC